MAAQKRFESLQDKIHLYQGDSAIQLAGILKQVSGRALIWLDAHYSGKDTARGEMDTPIMAELDLVARQSLEKHIILIDDARGFGIDPAYPDFQAIADFAKKRGYHFDAKKISLLKNKMKDIKVSNGQVNYEFNHLLKKLEDRDYGQFSKIKQASMGSIKTNKTFKVVQGKVESWEKQK